MSVRRSWRSSRWIERETKRLPGDISSSFVKPLRLADCFTRNATSSMNGETRLIDTVVMEYLLHILVITGIYIILTLSLNLLLGYTGLPAFGHAAFSCVGAYTSSLL